MNIFIVSFCIFWDEKKEKKKSHIIQLSPAFHFLRLLSPTISVTMKFPQFIRTFYYRK